MIYSYILEQFINTYIFYLHLANKYNVQQQICQTYLKLILEQVKNILGCMISPYIFLQKEMLHTL